MRLREVLREAWRDISSGASLAFSWAVVFGVLLAAVVAIRSAAVVEDVRAADAFVASGAATTVQRAEGRIDGRACDAFSGAAGVLASGALRRLDEGVVPAALPGAAVPTYEVTPGILTVLGTSGSTGGPGVVLSSSVGGALGTGPGDELALARGGSVPVSGQFVYPDDGRDPDLEYALLAPAADDGQPYDACWVTVWPQREDTVPMLRRAVLAATGAEGEDRATVGQLNPRLGAAFVPADTVPRWAPFVAAACAGLVVGGAAVSRRRLALASDLHIGVPRSAQVLGTVLQHVAWAVTAALTAVAVAVVTVRALPPADAWPIVHVAIGIANVGLVAALLGGAAAAVCVRERSLHRYFRTR